MDEQLDILISRYLGGTASDEEVIELERRLEADPAVAAALVAAAYDEEALRGAMALAAGQASPSSAGGHQTRLARPRSMPAVRWAALAACLLVGVTVGWRVLKSTPERPETADRSSATSAPAAGNWVVSSGQGVYVERGRERRDVSGDGRAALATADRLRTGSGGQPKLSAGRGRG